MPNPPFQARLWTADNSTWRVLPNLTTRTVGERTGAGRVLSAEWRVNRSGGYADATLVLSGRESDVSGLALRRRVEFWGRTASGSLIRLYRGEIAQINRGRQGGLTQTTLTLYGVFQKRGRLTVRQRWAFPTPIDLGSVFSLVANRWVKRKYPDVVVAGGLVGQTADSLDGWRRSFSDVCGEIAGLAGGLIAYGGEVDGDGNDVLFLRAFDDPATPKYTVVVPDPARRVVATEREQDISRITNALDLVGGRSRYPNLLAAATQGNTSFEYPDFNGEGTGQMLGDPGFEDRFISDIYGGASYKSGGLTEGPTDGGDDMVELDSVGEGIVKPFGPTGVTVGQQYTFKVRARLEKGTSLGSAIRLRIRWQNAGLATVADVDFTLDTTTGFTSAVWETFTLSAVCPAGATRGACYAELVTDVGDGCLLDNVAFYNSSVVVQSGWEAFPSGSASISQIDWGYEQDAYHGAYCLFLSGVASDLDDNDIAIRPLNDEYFPVSGNQTIVFSAWLKTPPGVTTHPKFKLQLFDYKADGTYLGESSNFFTPVTTLADWTRYELVKTVGASAAKCRAAFTLRGTGAYLVDSVMVRDLGAPAGEYVEAEAYEAQFRADAVYPTGPIHDSIDDWDELPGVEEQQSIATAADGAAYASAKFAAEALPLDRPRIVKVGAAEAWWPGEYIRAVGSEAGDALPEPLPIVEIEGRWQGGLLEMTAYPQTERVTETRILREIARRETRGNRSASTSSVRGAAGGSSGGTGGGSAPLARDSVSVSTGTLAAGATAQITVALGRVSQVFRVVASDACWLRVYSRAGYRTNDAGRVETVDPSGESAPLLEITFDPSNLDLDCGPNPLIVQREDSPSADVPISVRNTSGASADIALTFYRLLLES